MNLRTKVIITTSVIVSIASGLSVTYLVGAQQGEVQPMVENTQEVIPATQAEETPVVQEEVTPEAVEETPSVVQTPSVQPSNDPVVEEPKVETPALPEQSQAWVDNERAQVKTVPPTSRPGIVAPTQETTPSTEN